MPLRFLSITQPDEDATLDESQKAQLEIVSTGFDGGRRPASERLLADGNEEESFHGNIDYCVLGEREHLRYDLWLYNVGSGRLFRHGTTESLAHVIQHYFQFEISDTDQLEAELTEALHALMEEPSAHKRVNPLPRLPNAQT